jgi:SAM-dependent methyltransferase
MEQIVKFLMMNFYYQIDGFVIDIAKKYDQKGKKLLDVGAGTSPYEKYFKKLDYLAQDVKQNENQTIDYVGEIEAGLKEVKSSSFDYILCTQVLEHLREPQKVFEEFKRLLRPGGRLFLTTNFVYQIHMEPNDYFRFTEYGLRYLGEKNGFEIEHLKAQGGIFQVFSYLITTLPLRLGLDQNRVGYWLYLLLCSPMIVAINLMAVGLDNLDRKKRLTVNYEVIYKKKL